MAKTPEKPEDEKTEWSRTPAAEDEKTERSKAPTPKDLEPAQKGARDPVGKPKEPEKVEVLDIPVNEGYPIGKELSKRDVYGNIIEEDK
jgi:hypothetical protein